MSEPFESPASHLRVQWRSVAIVFVCLWGATAAGLVVLASVTESDTLATVALVLAVVTFIVQILLFAAQSVGAARQLEQTERVNSETRTLLAEVSSRVVRIDETQLQQFREIRETLLPAALGEKWASDIDSAVESISSLDPKLAELTEDLFANLRGEILKAADPAREVRAETIECPFCGTPTAVDIGSLAGDSSAAVCRRDGCGNRFHVHRDGSGHVFANKPGSSSSPASILRHHGMKLPGEPDRLSILGVVLNKWRSGELTTASSITSWMDEPSNVRTPLFFALVNLDYGTLALSQDDDLPLAKRTVEEASESIDASGWLTKAHAGWIAQALYRLGAWHRSEVDEYEFFFGSPDITPERSSILSLARQYLALVRGDEDGGSESGEAGGSGPQPEPGPESE